MLRKYFDFNVSYKLTLSRIFKKKIVLNRVHSSEKALSALKHELNTMKQANEKLESALQKLKVEVQVVRKKTILISRERDSYRQQLDLYEKDLTMTGMTSESLSNEMCSQMKSRIKNLEDALEEYRKHMELLESQLKEYQSGGNFFFLLKFFDLIF